MSLSPEVLVDVKMIREMKSELARYTDTQAHRHTHTHAGTQTHKLTHAH